MRNILQIYIAKLLWGLSEFLQHWCNGYTANRGPHCPIFSSHNFQPFCQFITIILLRPWRIENFLPAVIVLLMSQTFKWVYKLELSYQKSFDTRGNIFCVSFFRAIEKNQTCIWISSYQADTSLESGFHSSLWSLLAKEPGAGCSGFGCIEVSVNTPPQRWIRSTP